MNLAHLRDLTRQESTPAGPPRHCSRRHLLVRLEGHPAAINVVTRPWIIIWRWQAAQPAAAFLDVPWVGVLCITHEVAAFCSFSMKSPQ